MVIYLTLTFIKNNLNNSNMLVINSKINLFKLENIMKKVLFALCFIVTALCSCQENEDVKVNNLVGEWSLLRVELYNEFTGELISSNADIGEVWTQLYFENNLLLATIDNDPEDIESYSFVVRENSLLLIDGNWTYEYGIEKLTKKELVITYHDGMWVNDDEYIEGIAKLYYNKK